MRVIPAALLSLSLVSCHSASRQAETRPLPEGAEAISLLGDTLRPLPLSDAMRSAYQARLDSAQRAVAANPADADALIWLGRRTAYLGRYREAIAIFTRGVERFPSDPRFLRHRGHRWISVRETQRAAADLDHAARLVRGTADVVEPDGLPNARGIPTSTLHTNIWYHLGLAHYLRADYARALEAYRACLAASRNPDMDVAARYWLYLTLRRLGRSAEAAAVLEPVRADLDIIENRSYHRLLLVYKGLLRPIRSRAARAWTAPPRRMDWERSCWSRAMPSRRSISSGAPCRAASGRRSASSRRRRSCYRRSLDSAHHQPGSSQRGHRAAAPSDRALRDRAGVRRRRLTHRVAAAAGRAVPLHQRHGHRAHRHCRHRQRAGREVRRRGPRPGRARARRARRGDRARGRRQAGAQRAAGPRRAGAGHPRAVESQSRAGPARRGRGGRRRRAVRGLRGRRARRRAGLQLRRRSGPAFG